jgi:predicted nucleotidyltransferase component of viral defense system
MEPTFKYLLSAVVEELVPTAEMVAEAENFDTQAHHHHGFQPLVQRSQFKLVLVEQAVIHPLMALHQRLRGVALLAIRQMAELVAEGGKVLLLQQEVLVDLVERAQTARVRQHHHRPVAASRVLVQHDNHRLQTGLAYCGL